MRILIILFLGLMSFTSTGQNLTAEEITKKSEDKLRGESSYSEMKITIVRPKWTREMVIKGWAMGNDYSISMVTAPAKEAGTVFLKRKNEVWNWLPSIERTIKMPPSMLMQSWMGTDLTNDDLVRETSMAEDFSQKIIGEEAIDGRDSYKIELTPKPESAVVWGKVLMWIDKAEYLQLKIEFYDEDEYLVNTMRGKNIKEMGGKILTSIFEVIPAEKPNQKTIIEYIDLKFNIEIDESYFTTQNMKKIK